jgi:hypothetical protein
VLVYFEQYDGGSISPDTACKMGGFNQERMKDQNLLLLVCFRGVEL